MRIGADPLIASLRSNVGAGFRLGLFLPVTREHFRIGPAPFALLVLFNIVVWVAGSALRAGFGGGFNAGALAFMLASITLLLLICLVAAKLLRDELLLPALALLLVSTDLLFEIAGSLIYFAFDLEWLPDLPMLHFGIYVAYMGWAAASAVRAQTVLVPWGTPGSWPAAALLVAAVLAFAYVPRDEPWSAAQAEAAPPAEILREESFHQQGSLLARDLAALELQRPGVEDIYFLGVAPYALQDTFARELGTVRELFDQRFDTRGRSIVLVNHPGSVAAVPIASATSLRAALSQFGEVMNVEEDVLFLYMTTHGTEGHELAFAWPPLQLQQVNPTLLARMLADSGIKWRVIVLSACYSGGFVESLKDVNTVVITSSDAKRPSFGCETTSESTWFGRAFVDEALREQARLGTYSLETAFRRARESVAAREKAAGYEPSNPQMYMGEAMKEKLQKLEARLAAQPPAPPAPVAPQVQALRRAPGPEGRPRDTGSGFPL
ncbi:MAG: hypothetical protein FJY55_14140 [Betaproteobacteria bacterium]|nr:hypothetical protein [Betaproteobacteria bacterium]